MFTEEDAGNKKRDSRFGAFFSPFRSKSMVVRERYSNVNLRGSAIELDKRGDFAKYVHVFKFSEQFFQAHTSKVQNYFKNCFLKLKL